MNLKHLFLFVFLTSFLSAYSSPDLTIVGFLRAEDGLGKVPISILECLGEDVSVNYIATDAKSLTQQGLPKLTQKAINNSDKRPGKVALLTTLIWDNHTNASAKVPKSLIKLAYSMLETTKIPDKWVEILNAKFDAVIVPDENLVHVYENSGVAIPIYVLPIPMVLDSYKKCPKHDINTHQPFTFIDASANKNPGVLIEAFAKVFKNNPNVHLIMRAGVLHAEPSAQIKKALEKFGPLTNISFEEGHLSLQDFIRRLSASDCFVNLSRGEGFSFIPRECLALGLPVIITDNTASKTICNTGFVRSIPSNKLGPSNWIYKAMFDDACGQQFDCDVNDVMVALQDVYDNYSVYIEKARQGSEWVNQYDRNNPKLKQMYQTLIKPTQVEMGEANIIRDGILYTNSTTLFRKYSKLIQRG